MVTVVTVTIYKYTIFVILFIHSEIFRTFAVEKVVDRCGIFLV